METLIKILPKNEHRLCKSTIMVADRQNFDSVLRICDDNVINLLTAHVKGSEGTVFYLRIISMVLKSFLDLRLTPLERLRHLWFATFLIRIWKQFITENQQYYTMKDHIISTYTYACIEINAHSMIFLILYLKEKEMESFFHPEIVTSQPCEGIFAK